MKTKTLHLTKSRTHVLSASPKQTHSRPGPFLVTSLHHQKKQTVHIHKLSHFNVTQYVAFSLLNNQAENQDVTVGIVWNYIWGPDAWTRRLNLLKVVFTALWGNYTCVSGWHDWGSKTGNPPSHDSNLSGPYLGQEERPYHPLELTSHRTTKTWVHSQNSPPAPHPEISCSTLLSGSFRLITVNCISFKISAWKCSSPSPPWDFDNGMQELPRSDQCLPETDSSLYSPNTHSAYFYRRSALSCLRAFLSS